MYEHEELDYLAKHEQKCNGFSVIPYKVDPATVAEYCNKCGVWLATHSLKKRRVQSKNWETTHDDI